MAVLYKIEEKTILFIHIPKTGGGSVDSALSKYRVDEPKIIGHLIGHPTLEQCLKVVNPDHMFTVIRNPWDWRSSWFHYLKEGKSGQTHEYNNCKDKSFKDHLKWIDSEPRQNFTNSHYNGTNSKLFIKPQSEYINDNVRVLRFENLKGDFEDYMSDMGLDIKLNKHIHKSTNNNYVKEYDSETIKIVERQLKSDVVKFNYNFK